MAKEVLQAYQGAAPQPVRSVSIANDGVNVEPMTITDAAQLTHVGPPDLTQPPPLPRGMRVAPPPEDTGLAQELAELKQTVGQLTAAIGQQKADADARLEEQQLNHQIQLLSMRGPAVPTLPPGVDPNATLNVGDLTNILTRYGNDMQAGLIRQHWDVTPDEELAVLNANPSLAQLSEPDKTILTKRAVETRRRQRAPAPATPSSTPGNGSAASPAPQQSRPIAGRIVPMTEATSPGDVGELTPQNAYQQAQVEYAAADRIPNRAQRLAAKKAAMKKAQYALGVSDEQLAKMPFSQVS